jgi:cytochrome c5
MPDLPADVHEIVGIPFEPCGAPIGAGAACPSTRRFAIRRLHIGLYCGSGPGAHNLPWYAGLPWAKPADFVESGPFAGWLPKGAFPARRRRVTKRRGAWELTDSARNEFEIRIRRADAACSVCAATWYRGEPNSGAALDWLKTHERNGLFAEVVDAISKMMPKPTPRDPSWYERLPDDLRAEVTFRFDDSRLRAGWALSTAALRAAAQHEGRRFSAAVRRFAVDGLVLPSCQRCHRSSGVLLFESRAALLERWAAYRFSGSIAAARLHPDYAHFDYLAQLAYETEIFAAIPGPHQRERRAKTFG